MSMFTLTNTEIQRNCYTIKLIESGATWSKVAPTPRISPWGGSIWPGSIETCPGPMPARTPPVLPFRSGGGSSCVCIPGIGGNSYVSDAHDAVDMLPWVVLAKLHDLWRLAGQRKTLIKLATTILNRWSHLFSCAGQILRCDSWPQISTGARHDDAQGHRTCPVPGSLQVGQGQLAWYI